MVLKIWYFMIIQKVEGEQAIENRRALPSWQ